MIASTLFLTLSLLSASVSAGMYPANGPVKMLTKSNFKKTLSEEKSALVAFVAPWCGHCKALTPEYIKAAKALAPLVPVYAVDCDADENKPLCAEQEIKGFPTIKSFPRGLKSIPHPYNGERKAGAIVEWMTTEVPNRVVTLKGVEKIAPWVKESTIPRALLLTSKPKAPLMWKVLQNTFNKQISFGAAKDVDGAIAQSFGIKDATGKETQVLIWHAGASQPTVYTGTLKFDPLSKHFKSVLEGGKGRDEL